MEKFSTFDGKLFKEVDTRGSISPVMHTFQTFTVLVRQHAEITKAYGKLVFV